MCKITHFWLKCLQWQHKKIYAATPFLPLIQPGDTSNHKEILHIVALLLSLNVIPPSYLLSIEHSLFLGFPYPLHCCWLLTTLFLSWLCDLTTYTHSVSVLSPLPQQQGYLYHTNIDVLLSQPPSEYKSLTFQKVFSVWPLAKEWIGDIENNVHWRQRKQRMVLIVGTTGSVTLTHLLHRLDEQIFHSSN